MRPMSSAFEVCPRSGRSRAQRGKRVAPSVGSSECEDVSSPAACKKTKGCSSSQPCCSKPKLKPEAAQRQGPLSVQEAFQWPRLKLQQICKDPEREHRIKQILSAGVVATSDFSGMGGDREIMTQLEHVLAAQAWPLHAEGKRFKRVRSCDWARQPQRVLVHAATQLDEWQACVFDDLMNRLPQQEWQQVQDMLPPKDAPLEQSEVQYRAIADFIRAHRREIYNEASSSHCLVHGRPRLVQRWVFQHEEGAERRGRVRPLRINSAGASCVGWSSVGQQRRRADPSKVPHAIWLNERLAFAEGDREDLFFQECTVLYPVEDKLAQPLSDTHLVLSVKTGPQLQGFPSSRPRSLAVGGSKASLIWTGPTDPNELQADFDQIFASSMELTGDAFFLEDKALVRARVIEHAVVKRGKPRLLVRRMSKWELLQN